MCLTGWAGIAYEEKWDKTSQGGKTVEVKSGSKRTCQSSFVLSRAEVRTPGFLSKVILVLALHFSRLVNLHIRQYLQPYSSTQSFQSGMHVWCLEVYVRTSFMIRLCRIFLFFIGKWHMKSMISQYDSLEGASVKKMWFKADLWRILSN